MQEDEWGGQEGGYEPKDKGGGIRPNQKMTLGSPPGFYNDQVSFYLLENTLSKLYQGSVGNHQIYIIHRFINNIFMQTNHY